MASSTVSTTPVHSPISTAATAHVPSVAPGRLWALHSLCFVLPLTTLVFTITGPHPWWTVLGFLGVVAVSVVADTRSRDSVDQPGPTLPGWPFDWVLYVLAALQVANVVLYGRLVAESGFLSADALLGMFLVGINSGYSGIVVAHELIHRPRPHMRWIGRALLCTVFYEHFFTEHLRGHHARVATTDDPATARFGETYNQFWRRTVPAQFRSAWRLEAKRLGDPDMPWWDARLRRSRVVHGILAESGCAAAIALAFGPAALATHMLQALSAVRLLEAVNYFEHYGLARAHKTVGVLDSWDTSSAFTRYTLVGLSRHADHHAFATRPYQQLRHWEASPKLPCGYFGMVWMVLTQNTKLRGLLEAELRRRRLGPFAEAS